MVQYIMHIRQNVDPTNAEQEIKMMQKQEIRRTRWQIKKEYHRAKEYISAITNGPDLELCPCIGRSSEIQTSLLYFYK